MINIFGASYLIFYAQWKYRTSTKTASRSVNIKEYELFI